MRVGIAEIRWRLVMALVSLALTVAVTAPAAASRAISRPISDIWPNAQVQVGDEIWPNGPLTSEIWPNQPSVDGAIGGDAAASG